MRRITDYNLGKVMIQNMFQEIRLPMRKKTKKSLSTNKESK